MSEPLSARKFRRKADNVVVNAVRWWPGMDLSGNVAYDSLNLVSDPSGSSAIMCLARLRAVHGEVPLRAGYYVFWETPPSLAPGEFRLADPESFKRDYQEI